jgi:hypothetical protein
MQPGFHSRGSEGVPGGTEHQRARLGDLSTAPLTPEQHAEALALVAATFDDPALLQGFASFLAPEAVEELKLTAQELMRVMVNRQDSAPPDVPAVQALDRVHG